MTNNIIPKIRNELSITHPNNFKSVVTLNHHSGCYDSIAYLIPKIPKELSITHPNNFKSVVTLNHHS